VEALYFALGFIIGVLVARPANIAGRKQVNNACEHEWVEHAEGRLSIVYKCKRCLKMKTEKAY